MKNYVLVLALLFLTGCSREVLFQSDFNPTPENGVPGSAKVGFVTSAGLVKAINPPVTPPSDKWVELSRPNPDTPPAVFQGHFKEVRGDGRYTFSATVIVPPGTGVATIQFERQGQPQNNVGNFMHLDLMPNNKVRINDNPGSEFGTFVRGAPFVVQVTFDIDETPTARVAISGGGVDDQSTDVTSGTADHTIPPPNVPGARAFGAVRLSMAFPHLGTLQATNIVVTRRTD